eukprot:755158-Hanusia_phi.AAC.4
MARSHRSARPSCIPTSCLEVASAGCSLDFSSISYSSPRRASRAATAKPAARREECLPFLSSPPEASAG